MSRSRSIKFRAWSNDVKDMFFKGDNYGTTHDTDCITYARVILMQFTGLKDKNGTEIYEGDIVKHYREVYAPDNYNTGEPQFSHCSYERIGHITITASNGVTLNGNQLCKYLDEEIAPVKRKYNENPRCWGKFSEVIGNIYQNPELLEANNE